MKESLLKASHSSAFLLSEIKECHRQASPTQEIILRQLLQQAVQLEKGINEFAGALHAETNIGAVGVKHD